LNIFAFGLNPEYIFPKILNKAGLKNVIIVQRTIDPALLALNKKGFLNGHTPVSAYLAFLAVLCGVIFDIKYLAFSNEKSSQEHNLIYQGRKINHQWSKTKEFEKMFQSYSQKYLARRIRYFSFMREIYELHIAKIFADMKKYHRVFVSCNNYNKIKGTTPGWCGKCPKCLSTYILLSPFLTSKELKNIFGQNLLKKPGLKNLLQRLLGKKGIKPFECVGTFKELRIALYLSCKKYENNKEPMPYLLTYFKKNILPHYLHIDKESKRFFNTYFTYLGPA